MAAASSGMELAAALRRQWTVGGAKYVIIDACQDYELVGLLRNKFHKSPKSLFEGEAAGGMAEVAPYVIPVELSGEFLDLWAARWGGNTGVLFSSAAELETLHKHLRKIFIVEDDSGQEFFFRYYDPRVLRAYLPTCTGDEIRQFCGPVTSWCVEGEDTAAAVIYQPDTEGVKQTEVALAEVG